MKINVETTLSTEDSNSQICSSKPMTPVLSLPLKQKQEILTLELYRQRHTHTSHCTYCGMI